MNRRVVEHKALSLDLEELSIVTVYEPGIQKEQIKKLNPFSKRHSVLIDRNGEYELIE